MSEKLEFKTELKQLLHLITHSLYSNKEIFLRELISNASDAINKIKFDSLAHEERLENNKDWKIKIVADPASNTLTISDNGIGMNRESAIENLGTIAKSGTRAFLENLQKVEAQDRPSLIGQFGVGFYSAFMVASRVTVLSRLAGDPKEGVKWSSEGQGEFTVDTIDKPTRGTDVILELKDDEKELLQEFRLRQIIKKFSDYIEYPVVMDIEKGEGDTKTVTEETLNARKAIWLRSKKETAPEEYNEFYKQISNDFTEPARILHYTAEGTQEFRVLLFIPAHMPFDMQWGEARIGPRLYVQRVMIMDHCEELLPAYLRFVKGVVDSSDLPLNISRELLQQNPLLARIQKNLVKSILKDLDDFKTSDYDKYVAFFKDLGPVLKEGVSRDHANRKQIADLLLFESTQTEQGKYVTLAQYVEKMPADQEDIYYLIGESRELIEHSPYLESFRARGQDVLLLTDPIDEFIIPALPEYHGKKLKAVNRGQLDADSKDEKKQETEERFQKLLEHLQSKLPEVSKVRLTSRLKESAACLVADEGAMSAHMERLMERMGRGEEVGNPRRILELNGEHNVVLALQQLYEKDPQDARIELLGRLLYDEAVIGEGSKIKDPSAFARRLNELILNSVR